MNKTDGNKNDTDPRGTGQRTRPPSLGVQRTERNLHGAAEIGGWRVAPVGAGGTCDAGKTFSGITLMWRHATNEA